MQSKMPRTKPKPALFKAALNRECTVPSSAKIVDRVSSFGAGQINWGCRCFGTSQIQGEAFHSEGQVLWPAAKILSKLLTRSTILALDGIQCIALVTRW